MAITETKRTLQPFRHAIDIADRIPKQRYYDRDFFDLEADRLWNRTWQMACRLEEIPGPHDFTTYEILDDSIVVVRTEGGGVRAFQNSCRHRGVRFAEGYGSCETGFTCPFHGWCYGPDGKNTAIPPSVLLGAQPHRRRARPDAGSSRHLGWLRVDQPR